MKNNAFKNFLISPFGKFVMIVIFYALIWGFMVLCSTTLFENSTYAPIIMAVILGYFGWKALNRITPNIFLIMPIGGWFVYFFFKGMLSVAIGMFVAPFVIANMIADAIQISVE